MYDYIVVGSGFGCSVSALRLAEKGTICVLAEYAIDKIPEKK